MSSPETLVLRHMADVGWLSISGELFGIGPVASRHSRYFPTGRGNPQQPFPPHWHHLKRCSTRASCLFLGSAADCCRTSLGSGCAATPPSNQTTVISTHPGIKLLTADLISVPSFSAEPPHCSRPHGASRHSYFNNPAPSPCFLSPVLGRGQEYK